MVQTNMDLSISEDPLFIIEQKNKFKLDWLISVIRGKYSQVIFNSKFQRYLKKIMQKTDGAV